MCKLNFAKHFWRLPHCDGLEIDLARWKKSGKLHQNWAFLGHLVAHRDNICQTPCSIIFPVFPTIFPVIFPGVPSKTGSRLWESTLSTAEVQTDGWHCYLGMGRRLEKTETGAFHVGNGWVAGGMGWWFIAIIDSKLTRNIRNISSFNG